MKRMLMAMAVLVMGMLFGGAPVMANSGPALPVPNVAPVAPAPATEDFTDADFAQADQVELGDRIGGDALGFVVFVLVVVLIVLLILWLIREGHLR